VVVFRVRGDWRSRWSAMPPGPAFFRDMYVSKKDTGTWRPEAEGRDRKEATRPTGRTEMLPDPALAGEHPNLNYYIFAKHAPYYRRGNGFNGKVCEGIG
jgi:hypothetical protein